MYSSLLQLPVPDLTEIKQVRLTGQGRRSILSRYAKNLQIFDSEKITPPSLILPANNLLIPICVIELLIYPD